jgi:hypothetical protein
MTFDNTEHPRASDGKFAEKLGAAPEVSIADTEAIRSVLADHLEVDVADVVGDDYVHYDNLPTFRVGEEEYAIGTDGQATTAAEESFQKNIWALTNSHLAKETGLDEAVFAELDETADEGTENLEELTRLLDEHADGGSVGAGKRFIAENGRGQLLAGYDFEENEIAAADGQTLYLYRLN